MTLALDDNITSHHLGQNIIIRDEMLSSGADVIIWDKMLSSGMKCYHLELMLSSGADVIIWDKMLPSGMKCYFIYRRPTLYPLEIAVDFLKSL